MRDYTKTGKKVKCININRNDLTHKKVYDVFIDDDGDEFVIDDVGDKRSYRDWETDRKSTRLNSSHSAKSRMPSSA